MYIYEIHFNVMKIHHEGHEVFEQIIILMPNQLLGLRKAIKCSICKSTLDPCKFRPKLIH
jgi:hypothetical protein